MAENQSMKIGFIGLGIMGRPMALNLLKAGYPLWVHGRRPETMQSLVGAGALPCFSVGDVAKNAEIVFVMVSDTPDVERILLGDQGLLQSMQSGQVVVDMSTISPAASRKMAHALAQKGIEMLDAPVSGGEVGAINRTLSIMVGGTEKTFDRVKPLFEVLGHNVVHIGDHGAGQVAKGCNQIVAALTIEAVGEALTFARQSGVDPAKVRQALMGGFAGSKILEIHGQRMLENNFKPGFTVQLHHKDMRIVLDAANSLGIGLPGAALVAQHLNALVGGGDGGLDSSAIVKVVERMSGGRKS